MSDDFDNLRPIDDEDDPEDKPDWQQDQPKKSGGSASGDNLGFTGELRWRKDLEDAFDEQLDQADDDALEWQKDQPAGGSQSTPGGFGFTGELDWKKTQPGGESEAAGDEPLGADWMSDDLFADMPDDKSDSPTVPEEDDPFSLPSEPAKADSSPLADLFPDEDDPFALPPEEPAAVDEIGDDPLSWLQQYSAPDEQPEPESTLPEPSKAEVPSWLNDLAEESPEDEAMPDDLPPWLGEINPAEKPMSEGGKLSDDWLAGAAHAPETADTDMTFDQWQRIQDEVTRPRDIEDEMPDLFSEIGSAVTPNDLPTSDTGELPSWVLGMDELNTEQAPDWFTGNETAAPEPPSVGSPPADDIFGELGLPSPDTGYDFLSEPQGDSDLLAGLDLGESASGNPDWFSETEQPAVKDTPDWLQDLGDLMDAEPEPSPAAETNFAAELADDDFFSDLPDLSDELSQQPAEINPLHTPGLQDIDSLLASYDIEQQLPSTGELVAGMTDLDQIFSQQEMDEIGVRRSGEARPADLSGLSPDAPDWLTELGANVDEVSAAAIVRKQTQREKPLEELSDRLQALHDEGLELPTSEEAVTSDVMRTLLPGVNEGLSSAPIRTGGTTRTGDLVLTDAQRQNINLLRTLVGTEEVERRPARRPSAIDLTLATPNLDDMGILDEPDFEGQPSPEPTPVSRAPRIRRTPKFDRLLIALLLTIAVVLPFFVGSLRIGDLPPSQFIAGSRQEAVFTQIDSLQADDLALVAAEYGPTGAGELDATLDALLRHILQRGARPVVVSGNAVGLLHARNILDSIASDEAFFTASDRPQIQSGTDYFVTQYLAGGSIGLRAFGEDLPRQLSTDVNGNALGFPIRSLRDFNVIVVVAESAEEIRSWAEQVAPLAGKPVLVAVSQSAAPLSEPYVLPGAPEALPGLSGMLVGYRDAYTYRSMLDARLFPASAVTEIPTETQPPPTQTPIPTIETTAEPPVGAQVEASPTGETNASPTPEGARPTSTLPPTATLEPSSTPTGAPTNTPVPTRTPTPTDAPTSTPGLIVRAVIDSGQAVNVREGPGRTFAPIGSVTPGTIVQVIGRSGDGSWIQIRLDDGREGWVSADLLAIEDPEASSADASPTPESSARNLDTGFMMVSLISDDVSIFPVSQVETTPEATSETIPESTPEAVSETNDSSIGTAVSASLYSSNTYRDERWYGMTLGLVAIILVIVVGMIVNILRGLFRRRTR